MLSKTTRIVLFLLIMVLCIGCDQVTKNMASEELAFSKPIEYLNGFFVLIYAENTGAFMGMGENLPPIWKYILLVFLPTFVLFLFAITYLKSNSNLLQFIGMSLIVAGGTGNMIDRISQGAVIDFMNIAVGSVRTGIFNFADVTVTTGLILLLTEMMLSKKQNSEPVQEEA